MPVQQHNSQSSLKIQGTRLYLMFAYQILKQNLDETIEFLPPAGTFSTGTVYELTQGDIDTYGGGDGFVEITTTVDAAEIASIAETGSFAVQQNGGPVSHVLQHLEFYYGSVCCLKLFFFSSHLPD